MDFLTQETARQLVEAYVARGDSVYTTQEIIDSGAIPCLKGFRVKPGKVSDSIFGGEVCFIDKSTGTIATYENPPLHSADGTPIRIMVRTQRISTHDINRGEIPFKDQILAVNHNYMRRMLAQVIGTSQLEVGLLDNSNVVVAENLTQIPFENVLRAYMAKSSTSTSLYQHYMKGKRVFCGHVLPDNLIPNGPLPYVMDTPSTKSDEHDESIAPWVLVEQHVCTQAQYDQIRNGSLVAFGMISQFLKERGLIAVDTKTEHGINKRGEIVSQDEIWTMDSSRFWLREDYEEQLCQLKAGKIAELNPASYSKEFARGFSKGEQGYTEEQRVQIAVRYILGMQHLLGKKFEPDMRSHEERVVSGIEKIIEQVVA
ncbi:MAG: phosphoribosylaminoimidazolesuccinocarboxamide synthase [Nanoarchaeota archaeon]